MPENEFYYRLNDSRQVKEEEHQCVYIDWVLMSALEHLIELLETTY